MPAIYECEVCGMVSKVSDNLCHPDLQEDIHDFCGTTRERAGLCTDARINLSVVCGNCGRPAEEADLVCNPVVHN